MARRGFPLSRILENPSPRTGKGDARDKSPIRDLLHLAHRLLSSSAQSRPLPFNANIAKSLPRSTRSALNWGLMNPLGEDEAMRRLVVAGWQSGYNRGVQESNLPMLDRIAGY